MYIPVLLSCMASGCFIWAGIVEENKDICNQKLGVVKAHAQKDPDIKAYHGECITVRFSYDEKKKPVDYK